MQLGARGGERVLDDTSLVIQSVEEEETVSGGAKHTSRPQDHKSTVLKTSEKTCCHEADDVCRGEHENKTQKEEAPLRPDIDGQIKTCKCTDNKNGGYCCGGSIRVIIDKNGCPESEIQGAERGIGLDQVI